MILATLEDLMSRFPALWVVVGGVIVGLIGFLIARKAFTLSAAAQDRLVKILQESNDTLKTERDDYRHRLHDTRDKCQAVELKLKEAESRPDLSKLFETQQREADRRYEVYTQQTELIARQSEILAGVAEMQRKMVTDFEEHERTNAERQGSITTLLQRLCDGQADVIDMLNGKNKPTKVNKGKR